MSQFILCHFKGLQPQTPIFSSIKNNRFLLTKTALLSPQISVERLFSVDQFDMVCIQAQKDLTSHKPLKETTLYQIIDGLITYNADFFVWYGDEHTELESVSTLSETMAVIECNLLKNSGELYFQYQG